MPSLSKKFHECFDAQTNSIERTRANLENLLIAGHVDLQDIEHAYAGLFMELFTDFEAVLENLFFGLYSGSHISRHYVIARKSKVTPQAEIQPVIYSGNSYVNWLPYKENTLKRAKLYFDQGIPFNSLSNLEVDQISNYHIIRNAIAHKSPNSLDKFNRLIASLPLLSRERTPTGYLRSRPAGGQTQFEIAAITLKLLTTKLCL